MNRWWRDCRSPLQYHQRLSGWIVLVLLARQDLIDACLERSWKNLPVTPPLLPFIGPDRFCRPSGCSAAGCSLRGSKSTPWCTGSGLGSLSCEVSEACLLQVVPCPPDHSVTFLRRSRRPRFPPSPYVRGPTGWQRRILPLFVDPRAQARAWPGVRFVLLDVQVRALERT